MKRLSLFFAVVVAFLVFQSNPVKAEVVEIGALDFPPFYEVDGENLKGGLWKPMIEEIMKNAGIEYKFVGYPAKRLYLNVAEGKTPIWMGTKGVEEYKDKVLSSTPVTQIHVNIYGKNAENIPSNIAELKDKSVILIFGYHYAGLLKDIKDPANGIIIAGEAKTHESGFKMLEAGRADYIIDYKEPGDATLSTLNLKYSSKELKTVDIFFHVSKLYSNPEALMEKIQKSLDKYKGNKKE